MKDHGSSTPNLWLAGFAKLVVLGTFVLILIGGHTTTAGAGMAFPDWPLSHNSLNPPGWWSDVFERLEHGHRLMAEMIGLLVAILCAWVWRNWFALPLAIGVALTLGVIAKFSGVSREILVHTVLWSTILTFTLALLLGARQDTPDQPGVVRWFAFFAFIGVCIQAVLGGLRVTIESGGNPSLALAFRVVHGCFAQLELCLLVAIAALLAPAWRQVQMGRGGRRIGSLGWVTAGAVFLQLVVGASMRHMGAGLAIPSFPRATVDGKWMPTVHDAYVDLNFTHTRMGALVVSGLVVWLAVRAIRQSAGEGLVLRPAVLLLALLVAQIGLGVSVILQQRPLLLTTLHVVNGAALLAATVLISVRTTFAGSPSTGAHFTVDPQDSSGEVKA